MNAVEIEEAVSALAAAPFDVAEFPFQFLRAFGNKETTIKRLRSASTSDVEGGVLQRNAIHIAVCAEGEVGETLAKLRASPKTAAEQGQVHPGDRWRDAGGRGPQFQRDVSLRLPRACQPLRLFPDSRRHNDHQADPRQCVRHQSHRPPEQALCRASEGESRLGNGGAAPRHEPLHGAADLLFLRREHGYLQRGFVYGQDRAEERAKFIKHP